MNRTPPPQCNVDGASTVKHFPLWRRVASQATPLRNRGGACCGEVELSQDDALLTRRSLPTKFAQQRVDCQVAVQDVQAVPLHNAPASSSRSLAVSEAVPDNSPLVACRASGSAEPALNPPVKRRRLTCKQPAPESYGDVCLDVPMSWAVRRRAEQQFAAHWLKHKGGAQAPGNYDAKRRYGVHLFRALSPSQQAPWVLRSLATEKGPGEGQAADAQAALAVPAPASNTASAADTFEADLPDAAAMAQLRNEQCVGVLLTWNGSWAARAPDLPACQAEAHVGGQKVTDALRRCPSMQKLFESFWESVSKQIAGAGFEHCSAAMEHSTHPTDPAQIRVHLHLFCSWQQDKSPRRRVYSAVTRLKFEGKAASHFVPSVARQGPRGRSRAVLQGHYYLQMPKVGSLFRRATLVRFLDFKVEARWIMGFWRQRKLSHEDCLEELFQSRDHAHVHAKEVQNLQKWETHKEMERRCARLLAKVKHLPFKSPVECELEWLAQYDFDENSVEALPTRFSFMIYDGPSRTGKTELACSWFVAASTLVLNCQGVTEPNLHCWDARRYAALLVDECSWKLLWDNRALFQASVRPTLLGQSQCNEHAYWVSLYKVPIIACSNNFWEGCNDPKARNWIELNSFYRWIEEKTFEDT